MHAQTLHKTLTAIAWLSLVIGAIGIVHYNYGRIPQLVGLTGRSTTAEATHAFLLPILLMMILIGGAITAFYAIIIGSKPIKITGYSAMAIGFIGILWLA